MCNTVHKLPKTPVLEVKNLSISFAKHLAVNSISFSLFKNETLGIVGESGSGKSVSSLAIMGLLAQNSNTRMSGAILFENLDIAKATSKVIRTIRGKLIAMVFQEPMSSLNPSMRCGDQVLEILKTHDSSLTSKQAKQNVYTLFNDVKLANPKLTYRKYPHEISGGQKQRVMIAMAIACKPKVLIADEPTTALDVTVQKEIITLLKGLQHTYNMSVIFISHDLALVTEVANRVLVMYKGSIVEQGAVKAVFNKPKHDYTKGLINSKPSLEYRLKKLPTVSDYINNTIPSTKITKIERDKQHQLIYAKPPLLEVNNLEKEYFSRSGFFKTPNTFKAVNDVSFKLYEGETLGLVGESGCGKSTLGNAILQLNKATAGRILYKGKDITNLKKTALRKLRKDIQIIFQDPYASLNPRISVGKAIMEPMIVHRLYKSNRERRKKTITLLTQVGLPEDCFDRYPHEFSGGQRQRIGIARTIALQPKLIVCDESVSALDISVQAQVLNLLNELKDSFGFTYIFISHDLAVVKYMSDQLLVMNNGKIEEAGEADMIYHNPSKQYTKTLINAIPKMQV